MLVVDYSHELKRQDVLLYYIYTLRASSMESLNIGGCCRKRCNNLITNEGLITILTHSLFFSKIKQIVKVYDELISPHLGNSCRISRLFSG